MSGRPSSVERSGFQARRFTWRGRLLLLAGSIVAALFLGEMAVRLVMPQLLQWDTSLVWEPVEGLRWRRRPNLDVYVNTGERAARVLSDDARHRIGAARSGPGDVRILALGDSMVEALQVDYEQTMTGLLERSLSAKLGRNVEVVNAGVGGYDPNQYRMVAQSELRQSPYDLVLVFVYVENDIIGRRVESYPADTKLVTPALRPLSDGPAQTLRVLGVRGQALLATHSHMFVFIRNLLPYLAGLRHPPPPGMVHLLSAALQSNREVREWRITGEILNDIGVAADQARVPVLFILLPSSTYINPARRATLTRALRLDPADVDISQPAERLGEEMRKQGRELWDSAPALRQAFDSGERNLYGRIDLHFAPAGHRVAAQALEPIVLRHLPRAGTTP